MFGHSRELISFAYLAGEVGGLFPVRASNPRRRHAAGGELPGSVRGADWAVVTLLSVLPRRYNGGDYLHRTDRARRAVGRHGKLGSPANSVLAEGLVLRCRVEEETMDSHPWCSASCLLAFYRSSHALSRSCACGPSRITSLSRLARARVRPPVQRVDRALGGSTAIIDGSFVTCRRMGDP